MNKEYLEKLLLSIGFEQNDIFKDAWSLSYNGYDYSLFQEYKSKGRIYPSYQENTYYILDKAPIDGIYLKSKIFEFKSTEYEKISNELKKYFKHLLRAKKIKKLHEHNTKNK